MTDLVRLEDLPVDDRKALPYNHPILNEYAERVSKEYGLPAGLVNALKNAGEKSNSDQVSPKQAKGVMQLIPGTQKLLGVEDPTDPVQSIQGGARYVAQNAERLGTQDPALLAAAYHAGPGSKAARGDFAGSPITKSYAERVSAYFNGDAPADKVGPTRQVVPPASPAPQQQAPAVDPKDIPPAEGTKYDPSEGGSTLQFAGWDTGVPISQGVQRGLAGAGKAFTDMGRGVKQIVSKNPDYNSEIERAKLDEPLMKTGAGVAGYMGANTAALALPGAGVAGLAKTLIPASVAARAAIAAPAVAGAVATYGPGALSSGALSAISPTTAEGQREGNMALGAALGPALQKVGTVIGQGSPWAAEQIRKLNLGQTLQPVVNKAGDIVEKGMKPVTEWIGDNVKVPGLLRKSFNAEASPTDKQSVAKAAIADIPVFPNQLDNAGKATLLPKQAEEQKAAFTRAVNRTMGQETDDIPGAISAAHQTLSDSYNRILDGLKVPLDKNLSSAASKIQQDYLRNTKLRAPNSDLDDAIQRLSEQVTQGGQLTGRQLQDAIQGYASDAVAASRSGMFKGQPTGKPDHAAAKAFRDLSDLLESHASQFMKPGDAQAFAQTNKQWRNMKTIEQVAPTANGVEDFSPVALARRLKATDGKAYLYNKGDTELADLAKFGTKFMGMDANAPTSMMQRMKQSAANNAPVLAGDMLGGYAVGKAAGAEDPGYGDNVGEDLMKYALGAYMAHHALGHTRKALNPKIDLKWLNQPRGALSEVARRGNVTPGVMGALSNQENAERPPYVELRGMAED